MNNISVKIVNRSGNSLPAYQTYGSSGMDICASLEETVTLEPMQRVIISTGLFIELPEGYEAQIRPRSGLALKNGITCLNSPGTIDADYRGEIKIILINLSNELQSVSHGERVAQMIVQPVTKVEWINVQQIEETQRGSGGFGHTGK